MLRRIDWQAVQGLDGSAARNAYGSPVRVVQVQDRQQRHDRLLPMRREAMSELLQRIAGAGGGMLRSDAEGTEEVQPQQMSFPNAACPEGLG